MVASLLVPCFLAVGCLVVLFGVRLVQVMSLVFVGLVASVLVLIVWSYCLVVCAGSEGVSVSLVVPVVLVLADMVLVMLLVFVGFVASVFAVIGWS